MPRVLIAGGSGLIGRSLSRRLMEHGYEVAVLSRNRHSRGPAPTVCWNPDDGEIPVEEINSCDYIINLAGANIGAKRWTASRKKEIRESRIKPAGLIFESLEPGSRISAYISSSATGYYGALTTGKIFVETDPPAGDFLGETCRQWEEAADSFARAGIRTVKIRTGIVLDTNGGILQKLQLPIRLGLASAIGTGKQYMPWIHNDDLCNIYIRAIQDQQMKGCYNAVAPEHVTNREFTRKAAHALRRPFWFPNIPGVIMKLLFGEMSVILLEGSRVSSEKIESTNFSFTYPELDLAFGELYSK